MTSEPYLGMPSREEWQKAQERLKKLDALEAMGVDNWQGYDEAMRELYSEDDED